MRSISVRLRSLREENNCSQKQIAQLLCVGQCTYSGYESGKIRISSESLIKLAKFYNVDMNYICGISDVRRPYPKQ